MDAKSPICMYTDSFKHRSDIDCTIYENDPLKITIEFKINATYGATWKKFGIISSYVLSGFVAYYIFNNVLYHWD